MRPLILTGFILLVVRLLVLNIVLEPTNDEGLWQWNARCDHWDLPAHGILHSALSPVNYWVSRTVFALTSPSIVAKRVFNSLLVAVAAAFALQRLSRAGNPAGAVMFLSWLWLDPYLFRMGSWAILEPLLMAGLVACNVTTMRKAWDVRTAVLSGALAGLLVGVKITVLWLPAGLGAFLLFSRRVKDLLFFGAATVLVSAASYVSVYGLSDHDRFLEIWRQHTAARTSVGSGLSLLISGAPDVRVAFYAVTALFCCGWGLLRTVRTGVPPAPALWAVVTGLLMLATQTYRPDRYVFPVAFLALLAALEAGMLRTCRKWMLAACLGLGILSNGLWWQRFVADPANSGGWALVAKVQAAARDGRSLAAPPHLALGVNHPVLPTSVGLLADVKGDEALVELLVIQTSAADLTKADVAMDAEMHQRKALISTRGFYTTYQLPAAARP